MDTSALSAISAAADDRRLRDGASLKFFYRPMDRGKSTLALQLDCNHSRRPSWLVLTRNDRSLGARVTTRIGLAREAIEVTDGPHRPRAAAVVGRRTPGLPHLRRGVLLHRRPGRADGRPRRHPTADLTSTTGHTSDHEVHYRVLCRRHYRSGELGPEPTGG